MKYMPGCAITHPNFKRLSPRSKRPSDAKNHDLATLRWGVRYARSLCDTAAFKEYLEDEYWPGQDVQVCTWVCVICLFVLSSAMLVVKTYSSFDVNSTTVSVEFHHCLC